MEEINSLTFYRSFYEAIKNLNQEQRLQLYDAIFQYQFEDKIIQFDDPILNSFWTLIQPNIDASNSKKLAGAKGGRPSSKNKKASFSKNKKGGFQNKKASFSKNENLGYTNSKSEEEEEEEEEVEEEAEADAEEKKSESISASATNKTIKFYLDNINPMPTPREVEILESYENDTPEELIQYAMEKAVENKARSLGYIKAILNSWRAKGITTLEEAKEETKEKDEKQGRNSIHAGRVGTI